MYESWSPTLKEEITLRVLENRAMRRMFDLTREKMKQGFRKFPREFYNLYSSLNVIFMIKSRRIGRVRPVALMGEQINVYKLWGVKPEGKRPLERFRIKERIILKWNLEKKDKREGRT
jgi:hypothetical protein